MSPPGLFASADTSSVMVRAQATPCQQLATAAKQLWWPRTRIASGPGDSQAPVMSSQGDSEQRSPAVGEWAEEWDLQARKGQTNECSHKPGHGDMAVTQPSQLPVHSRVQAFSQAFGGGRESGETGPFPRVGHASSSGESRRLSSAKLTQDKAQLSAANGRPPRWNSPLRPQRGPAQAQHPLLRETVLPTRSFHRDANWASVLMKADSVQTLPRTGPLP